MPWLHTLDPYALGPIRWYGLAYVAGFAVAFLLLRLHLKRPGAPLSPAAAADLVVALAIGAVVGGRLGYIAFYQPSLLWTVSDELPFWDALALNRGGMASHGGMIGVVVAAAVFARKRGSSFLSVLDLAAYGAPLGLFFGRIANFINGELYGRPVAESFPLAMKFPQEMLTWSGATFRDVAAQLGAASATPSALLERVQQGDTALATALAPYLTARHPSQLYEAVLEGLVVFAVVALLARKARPAGTIAAAFGLSYGVVRIVGEQFRLPDASLVSVGALDITRGQALSVLLLAASVIVLLFSRLRHARKPGSPGDVPDRTATSIALPTASR